MLNQTLPERHRKGHYISRGETQDTGQSPRLFQTDPKGKEA